MNKLKTKIESKFYKNLKTHEERMIYLEGYHDALKFYSRTLDERGGKS